MIKTKVSIRDSGMDDLLERVKKLHGRVDVGVFGEDDSEQVIIAGANEFGTENAGRGRKVKIPQRSFLRSTLDDEQQNARRVVDRARIDIVTGKTDRKTFLNRLGLWLVGKVEAKILAGGDPFIENAPSTKADKIARGREWPQPLNDSGHLRRSIKHKVRL